MAVCAIDEGIWAIDGHPVRFLTFPYSLRSIVVDLGGGELFVHSPVQLAAARDAVDARGVVRHLVSPNKLHHLFLGQWKAAYPNAALYAPPGLRARRPDLSFDADLADRPARAWAHMLDQVVVRGSFFMDEVLFFHRQSRSLLVGDLIENHDPQTLDRWHRILARANAMLAPHGKTPRNFRLTFWRRNEARQAIRQVLCWEPRRVLVMHGPLIENDAVAFLRRAFAWLL